MTEQQHARPFAEFLVEQGASHGELSDAFRDLVQAVTDTGKPGTLTYTVKVEPDKKAEGMLRVSDKVAAKTPEYDRVVRVYWQGRDGNLTRQNPHQPTFDGLQVVESPARPAPISKEQQA